MPDAGIVKYRYNKNGNRRFQQDPIQALGGKFTYRRYDRPDRVIEAGEYSVNFPTCDSTTTGNPANGFPGCGGTLRVKNIYENNISGDGSARKLLGL